MYAVMTTGGKQYRVEAGSELTIERLGVDAGASITFDRVLLVGDGDAITVGTPTIDGATVSATVLGEALGPKLTVFKFKQKVKYRRMAGHRQHLLRVRIDEISADGKTATAPAETKAESKTESKTKSKTTARAASTAEATDKPKRTRKAAEPKAEAAGAADAEAKPKRTRKPAAAKASDTEKAEE